MMVFRDKSLRTRIWFTLGALAVFRLLATIPMPGIDLAKLQALFSGNQFLGLMNLFSGGGLYNLSIVMLGVGPYITSSIIMQLMTMMFPKLKALYQEEGELGRLKFAQYSRMLTVPLAFLQALSFIALLKSKGVVGDLSTFSVVVNAIVITGGSIFLMWLGELVSEFGIGNGVSLLIFAGIVAYIPKSIINFAYTFELSKIPVYIGFAAAAAMVIYAVVVITEAERPIPITYAKRIRGMKVYGGVSTYLPLRLNQSGVIPIVFALSILLFPQMIFGFLSTSGISILAKISSFGLALVNNQWFYSIMYFVMVFLFTYFYTAVTFDPDMIATNLQKNGAFIPGVRPGQSTSEYVAKILTRLTLFGALFLGVIAVLPLIMRALTENTVLAIGGTALLIVVSVVIDLIKKIDAQVSMCEY